MKRKNELKSQTNKRLRVNSTSIQDRLWPSFPPDFEYQSPVRGSGTANAEVNFCLIDPPAGVAKEDVRVFFAPLDSRFQAMRVRPTQIIHNSLLRQTIAFPPAPKPWCETSLKLASVRNVLSREIALSALEASETASWTQVLASTSASGESKSRLKGLGVKRPNRMATSIALKEGKCHLPVDLYYSVTEKETNIRNDRFQYLGSMTYVIDLCEFGAKTLHTQLDAYWRLELIIFFALFVQLTSLKYR